MSILIAPHMFSRIIYAILIPLHRYPHKGVTQARFSTEFIPKSSWTERSGERNTGGRLEKKKPKKNWLMGLRHYYGQQFPRDERDPRRLGFAVGKQIAGLYLTEMLLKFALDDRSIDYTEDHNLEMLFQLLPVSDQKSLRDCYKTILHSQPGHSWDIERSIDDLLAHLGRDPITESRYFWDINTVKRKGVLFAPQIFVPLIDSLFTVLHHTSLIPPGNEYFEKDFQSFEESLNV